MQTAPTYPVQWIEALSGQLLNAGPIASVECISGLTPGTSFQSDGTATLFACYSDDTRTPLTNPLPQAEAEAAFKAAKSLLMQGKNVSLAHILAVLKNTNTRSYEDEARRA